MGKTYAEVLIEEGIEKGIEKGIEQGIERGIERGIEKGEVRSQQKTLLRQLEIRFGRVPAAVRNTIETTTNVQQLDVWLERFATATTFDDVGIES